MRDHARRQIENLPPPEPMFAQGTSYHRQVRRAAAGFNKGAAANRRYAGQLDDFMKFDCQDFIQPSPSAAVAELER